MQLTDAEYAATAAKVARLNERAARRGWTGRVTIEREVIEKRGWNDALKLETVRYVNEVTIGGEPAKYEGWTFLAKLDWDPEAGLIVSTAPGVRPVDRSTLAEGACDHCKQDRNRRHVFLVRHDDGRQLQVGTTCTKDFLGWDASPVWISEPSMDGDLAEESFGRGGGAEERWGTETVLAVSWACIKTWGWVPAGEHSGVPTKSRVTEVLDPRSAGAREAARKVAPHITASAGQASLIREYIASGEFAGDSEYVINLTAVARADSCAAKNLGLLVSAPQTWARRVERDLRRQAETAGRNNTWAGQVSDRIEITATVKAIRYQDGDYGTTTIYTLSGQDGRTYTWYSSAGSLGHEVTGQPVTLKGTIKKLEDYRGARTTSLARCKVIDTEPAKPAAQPAQAAAIDNVAISARLCPEIGTAADREAC